LNEIGEATVAKDSAESGTGEVSWLEHPVSSLIT